MLPPDLRCPRNVPQSWAQPVAAITARILKDFHPSSIQPVARGEPSKPDNVSTSEWNSLMSNERNSHRNAVVLFAVTMIVAILAAVLTTLERVDTRTANNETPPGTTGLARPRPPLDRAPGQPLGNWAATYPAGR